jgi:hypothetical protein
MTLLVKGMQKIECSVNSKRERGASAARLLAEIDSNPAYIDKVLHIK